MITTLILIVSLASSLQFFVSFCRSLIADGGRLELSKQAREIAGLRTPVVDGDEFHRLVRLAALCPDTGDSGFAMHAVGAYYRLLSHLRASFRRLAPSVATWAEREREGCAYYAAVTLDRRISFSYAVSAQRPVDRL